MMRRREFVEAIGGALVASVACRMPGEAAAPGHLPGAAPMRRAFQWGVASADPQPHAIMLWTKVVPLKPERDARLVLQLSRDPGFGTLDLEQRLRARRRDDHSARVLVTRLTPETTYYFRFIAADGAVSRMGRTWTAPSPTTAREVLIAVASCQSYPPSQYGAYRNLLAREKLTGERPDFVLHLGDYVYGSDLVLPLDPLTGLSGPSPPPARPTASAPSRGSARPRDPAAAHDDYATALEATRALYAKYHLDRDLQDVRAAYPLVTIWDDHEFGNDVWQSYSGVASNPAGRLAASKAWSEWVPQILSASRPIGSVANHARDFRTTTVKAEALGAFDADYLAHNRQNLKAIGAMTSYRAIRWGALVDLLITDNRSYRAPGADPSATSPAIKPVMADLPLWEARTLDHLAEGRFADDGDPPAVITDNGRSFANPRRDAPRVSMLGARQKAWLKQALVASDARWKLWANPEPITPFSWDFTTIKPELGRGRGWLDGWDGFPNERRELLGHMREQRLSNIIALAGDRHAHFAALVADDDPAAPATDILAEFTCSGISAFTRATNLGPRFERLGIGRYAWAAPDGGGAPICTLDTTLTGGVAATDAMLAGADAGTLARLAEQGPNPHLRHADTHSHGYLLARFTAEAASVEFVTMPDTVWDPMAEPDGPAAQRTAKFDVPAWQPGQTPVMRGPQALGS